MPINQLPKIECACASARRAARLVTQFYSQEMGPQIEPGQFSLLTAIDQMPECSQASLGRAMGFDKTTLSRNLALMKRNGWIEPGSVGHRLTPAGVKLLAEIKPAWRRAQKKLRTALKTENWDAMLNAFEAVAQAASEAR